MGELTASVILPTCNRPGDLHNALLSLSKQTFTEFEVLIINDGDGDFTQHINLSGDALGKLRLHLLRTSGFQGPAAARNTGLQAATGDIIFYLDDDDIFLPEHLQTHMQQYTTDKDKNVLYTNANRGIVGKDAAGNANVSLTLQYAKDFDADALLVSNYIPILCLSHRAKCLEKTGLFEPSLGCLEDWDLFIRLALHYDFSHIPEITAIYFEKGLGSSVQERNRNNFIDTLVRVYQRADQFLEHDQGRVGRLWTIRLRHLGTMAFQTGAYFEACQAFELAAAAYANAAEYDPAPERYLALARVQKRLGQRKKALISMQLAQECRTLRQ